MSDLDEKVEEFDGAKARRVREGARLGRRRLSKLLWDKAKPSVIYRYECMDVKPINPPVTKLSSRYMFWLIEHGYDPYKLKDTKWYEIMKEKVK